MKRFVAPGFLMLLAAIACGFALASSADDRAKPQTAGPLAPVAFLAGTWRGMMNESEFVEEIWSEPSPKHGDTMVGVFRWLNAQGRPRMYEILTLSHEEGEIILRLRHFTAEMTAWEEKDAPVTLRLRESHPGKAEFVNVAENDRLHRVVFARGDRILLIDVQFREGMGDPLAFRLERAGE